MGLYHCLAPPLVSVIQLFLTLAYDSSIRPWRRCGMPPGRRTSSRCPRRGARRDRHTARPVMAANTRPLHTPAHTTTATRARTLQGQHKPTDVDARPCSHRCHWRLKCRNTCPTHAHASTAPRFQGSIYVAKYGSDQNRHSFRDPGCWC